MHWAERFSFKLNWKARYTKRNLSAIILYFDIVACVLQLDTLTLYLFILSFDYVHRKLIKVKLMTVVEGDQKAPISILDQGLGEGTIPFPGLFNFTLDTYLILLIVKQGGIKYHF